MHQTKIKQAYNFQKLPAPTKEITVYNHNRLYEGRGKENEYSYMLR